jgi:hypothetical protein
MFDHGGMSSTAVAPGTIAQLQDRIRSMQDGVPRIPVATPTALDGLLGLRTGGAYEVDSASLALALLAAPSREGAWSAVVGVDDFGVEAAAEMGVDLTRTVLVPEPGEHWLEATAALIDVVTVVLLRPPAGVTERAASRIVARLRKRSAVLLVRGRWPGSEARLDLVSSTWTGVGHGHGRLVGRRLDVAVTRGSAPARRVAVDLAEDGVLRRVEVGLVPGLAPVVGGVG